MAMDAGRSTDAQNLESAGSRPIGRDPQSRQNMFADYAEKARKRGMAPETMALRTESVDFRELLAYLASDGKMSYREVESAVLDMKDAAFDYSWLAKLARVSALQNFFPEDRTFGLAALRLANSQMGKSGVRRFRKLEVELAIEAGEDDLAAERLDADEDLRSLHYGYLRAELENPYRAGPYADPDRWLRNFNEALNAHGLEEVEVGADPGTPFDRLRSLKANTASVGGPRVSVVMTAYRPSRSALIASVRSILEQTWANLEVIVVDDASGPEFSDVFEELPRLDDRLRVISLANNSGTYGARNAGFAAASGVYVTGQDADDWSHPRRIETQVLELENDSSLPGVRTAAVNCSESLSRVRPGYNPLSPNASSLMVPTRLAQEVGGYMRARKGADNEFHQRLERYVGATVKEIAKPLTFVRILPDSLSRSDFRAEWSHPARRAFRAAYQYWHRTSPRESLRLGGEPVPPVPVPFRLSGETSATREFDVIYAGEWASFGGPQKSMLEEIAAARRLGLRVGVLNLEAARFMSVKARPVCEPLQTLINSGEVTQVLQDDDVTAGLVILRYPPILQFPPYFPFGIAAERLLILANQAPSERDGTDIRYIVSDCTANARRLFGVEPVWVPQGPTVREALAGLLPDGQLADYDMPGILDLSEWATDRSGFRSRTPVIGRHSRDNAMKWPEDADVIGEVYPLGGEMDVRIMGGSKTPRKVLAINRNPSGWVVFEPDELPVRTFLNSIDFFVYYQHSQAYDAFGRAVLEAIAAGCVAILPHHFEPTFGDAAIYRKPDEVAATIFALYADPERYREHVDIAQQVVRHRFSHEGYGALLQQLLSVSGARDGGEE